MELIFVLFALIGAISLAYAILGFVGEVLMPALTRKPYRPAATRRARP